MATIRLHAKARNYLDGFGTMMERVGMPRETGLIWGWLLICDPPCQTIDEMAATLEIAPDTLRQHVSVMEKMNLLERIPLREKGKECIALLSLDQMMDQRMALVRDILGLLDQGRTEEVAKSPEAQERLRQWHCMYTTLQSELPKLLEPCKSRS